MTWAKLDDGFWSHPKVDRVSLSAVGVYVRSLSYCGDHLTDGHVTPDAAIYMAKGDKNLVRELVAKGLWEKNGDGYLIPDFLDFNPSRKHVLLQRKRDARRKRQERRADR